jgi:hypothetical protein
MMDDWRDKDPGKCIRSNYHKERMEESIYE